MGVDYRSKSMKFKKREKGKENLIDYQVTIEWNE